MFRQGIRDFPIFKDFSDAQMDGLAQRFELRCYPPKAMIFDQGQAAKFLYILASGKVIIRFKPYDGPPLTVATIEPGGVFGWSAALGRALYTSGALTGETSEVYRISGMNLNALCTECPDTGAVLIKRLASMVNVHQQGSIQAESEIVNILQSSMDKNGDCSRRIKHNGR